MNEIDLLRRALASGIIDLTTIQGEVRDMERQKTLSEHSQKIWQGSNGYWYTYVGVGEERRLIKKRERSALDDVLIKLYGDDSITVSDDFHKWVEQKYAYGDIQRQTKDKYTNDFNRYFGKIKELPIKYITEEDLEKFIKTTIINNSLKSKDWGNMRILIYGIWKFAKRKGHTDLSITAFMGDMELSKKIFKHEIVSDDTQVFSGKEYDEVLKYTYKDVSYLSIGVRIALLTGMRAGEISTLKISDLNGNELTVQRTEIRFKDDNDKTTLDVRNTTKGAIGYRKIVLTEKARNAILEAYENYGGEYLIEHEGKRVSGQSFSLKMYRICDNLGITRRSLHKCRKTYASRLIEANVPEKLVLNQMGHTNILTTKNYYWFRNSSIEEDKEILEKAMITN